MSNGTHERKAGLAEKLEELVEMFQESQEFLEMAERKLADITEELEALPDDADGVTKLRQLTADMSNEVSAAANRASEMEYHIERVERA